MAFSSRFFIGTASGLVFIAGTTTTLLLALQWGGRSHDWASLTIVGLFVASGILLAGMVVWESRTEAAIIPPHLFRNSLFRSTMLVSVGAGLLLGSGPLLFPLFLQYATGRSATNSGLIMLPVSLGTLAGATFAGRYIASTGRYRPLALVGFVTAGCALVFVATMGVDVRVWLLTIVMFVFGTALATTGTVASTASQSAVEPSELGVANGVNLFIRMVGASVSVAVSGAVFDARLGPQSVANPLERFFVRRTPQIEADDRQLATARLDHHRRRFQRIERALRKLGVAIPVAPHRDRFCRRDVARRRSRQERVLLRDGARSPVGLQHAARRQHQ